MPYTLRYHPRVADHDLKRIPKATQRRIEAAIASRLAVDPVRYGAPLSGTLHGYRKLRVGDHRVVYKVSGTDIWILAIVHRRDVYERASRRSP